MSTRSNGMDESIDSNNMDIESSIIESSMKVHMDIDLNQKKKDIDSDNIMKCITIKDSIISINPDNRMYLTYELLNDMNFNNIFKIRFKKSYLKSNNIINIKKEKKIIIKPLNDESIQSNIIKLETNIKSEPIKIDAPIKISKPTTSFDPNSKMSEPLKRKRTAFSATTTRSTELWDHLLIIQLGSSHITIGRALERKPLTLPLTISLRDRNGKFPCKEAIAVDEVINGNENIINLLPITTGTTLASTCGFISNAMHTGGPYKQANECLDEKVRHARETSLNKPADTVSCSPDWDWTDVKSSPERLVCKEALRLPPTSEYTLYYPLRHGGFNISNKLSVGRIGEFIGMIIEDILTKRMNISRKDFSESVAAVYGSSKNSALVVDIGSSKTHVVCIEEGLTLPRSRVLMPYGGDDITEYLLHILRRENASGKGGIGTFQEVINMNGLQLPQTFDAVNKCKETICKLSNEPAITLEYYMSYKSSMLRVPTHSIQTFCSSLAPQLLFNTSLVASKFTRRLPLGASFQSISSSDFLSASYIDMVAAMPTTKRELEKFDKEVKKKKFEDVPNATNTVLVEELCNEFVNGQANLATQSGWVVDENKNPKKLRLTGPDLVPKLISIDEAIIESLNSLSSDELKSKFIENVILVGGGSKLSGLSQYLEAKLKSKYPDPTHPYHKLKVCELEQKDPKLISEPVNVQLLSWKGLAVLAYSDTNRDSWVDSKEWEFNGSKILRGKIPYLW